jgi:integrase
VNRPKDRLSSRGLLPRMEARLWKDGVTITYRYHPFGGVPVSLGTDRIAAIKRVLDITGESNDQGTIAKLWSQYQETNAWTDLAKRTQEDYTKYSGPLLRVFGGMRANEINATIVSRYLRVEREDAPVRANREIALLGNLIGLAIERGEADHNPCRGGQVKRNKERPRTRSPERGEIDALIAHAHTKGGQWVIIMAAAEFAALAGSRKAEFLGLAWSHIGETEIRLLRAKQRGGSEKAERVEISPAMSALLDKLRPLARDDRLGTVFLNRQGNPYTSMGFAAMWGKLMREALGLKIIERRFTFHDLRAHYTTRHKVVHGDLPDLHTNTATTARVYERSKMSRRKAL